MRGTITRIGCLIILLAAAMLFGCSGESQQLTKGQPTPSFTLARIDGQSLAFPADTRGKVVAIRFWADWCPFCKTEMKDIEPVYRKYREAGLEILAINVRQDRDTAAAFVGRLGVTYDTLLDVEGQVARDYGVLGLPTTFIVDREGRLHTRILGESTAVLFEQLVRELL